jgi:hypothetical protein
LSFLLKEIQNMFQGRAATFLAKDINILFLIGISVGKEFEWTARL